MMTAEDASHPSYGYAPIVHRYKYLAQLFTALTHVFAQKGSYGNPASNKGLQIDVLFFVIFDC